jgi:hypothetical protein
MRSLLCIVAQTTYKSVASAAALVGHTMPAAVSTWVDGRHCELCWCCIVSLLCSSGFCYAAIACCCFNSLLLLLLPHLPLASAGPMALSYSPSGMMLLKLS